jgi:hypothetical protein
MEKLLSIITIAGVVALSSQARAQETNPPATQNPPTTENPPTTQNPPTTYQNQPTTYEDEPGAYSYAWREPRMRSKFGVAVILGGGITGFIDAAMRDVMKKDFGGLWDLRVSMGTHVPLGLDVSYVGTATSLQTIAGIDNGTLIGTTVEGALRYNILPHFAWNPYVFAGVGWQRYDVTDASFLSELTGMSKMDNVLEFPVGAGVSYRDGGGFLVDVRGTFRAATDSDLLRKPDGDQAPLHSWEASGAIGYEF